MNAASRLSAVALALAISACSVRTDFIRATGAPLTLAADPERPGGVVVKQGDQVLDEESFYRIVEDPEASRRFTVHRRHGKRLALVGGVTLGLGLGSGALGGLATALGLRRPDLGPENLGVGVAALSLGVAAVLLGLPLAAYGELQAGDVDLRLLDDQGRLRRAVERYNQNLLRVGAPKPGPEGKP